MEKSVQNKSEGILGAIKAVTHKPASVPVDTTDSTSVPGMAPKRTPITRQPSSLVREITLSRSAEKALRKEEEPPKKELPKEKATPVVAPPVEDKVEDSLKIGESQKKATSNPQTKAQAPVIQPSEVTEVAESNSKKQPEVEAVLPSMRPASVNRDVDQVLDSLNLKHKDTEYLVEKVRGQISNNLLQTEIDDIRTPDMSIAGPVFNSLQYVVHQPQVVMLYSNLLSTAMSKKTARFAHPGFVDLIRNITEDEARVLSWFYKNKILPVIDIKKVLTKTQSEMRLNTLVSGIAREAGCEFDDLAEGYLANLERIGLLEIPRTICLTDSKLYENVLSMPAVQQRLDKLNGGNKDSRGAVVKYYAKLSVYGIKFCHACIR